MCSEERPRRPVGLRWLEQRQVPRRPDPRGSSSRVLYFSGCSCVSLFDLSVSSAHLVKGQVYELGTISCSSCTTRRPGYDRSYLPSGE